MFFWTRAILCIGTVTVLAVQRLPPEARITAAPALPSAATVLGAACRTRPDLCAAAVTQGLGQVAPGVSIEDARDALGAHPKLLRRLQGHQRPVALLARSLT